MFYDDMNAWETLWYDMFAGGAGFAFAVFVVVGVVGYCVFGWLFVTIRDLLRKKA